MKLGDFERTGDRTSPRFVARVPDVSGAEEFELTLAGPAELMKEMLGDAELELTIDAQRSQDELLRDCAPAQEQQRESMWELAALTDVDALLKPDPRRPDRRSAVLAAARPVKGTGTPFAFTVSGFFVPTNASFFFFGSFVLFAVGSLRPATGDQDLFLQLFTPTGPSVSSSRLGGTSRDVVSFGQPLFPWVPCYRVFGFSAGVCSVFSAGGV